jgi:hypothetical protein
MNHQSSFPAFLLPSPALNRLSLVIVEMGVFARRMVNALTREVNQSQLSNRKKQDICSALTERWDRPPSILVDHLNQTQLECCVTLQEVWQEAREYDPCLTPKALTSSARVRYLEGELRALESRARWGLLRTCHQKAPL